MHTWLVFHRCVCQSVIVSKLLDQNGQTSHKGIATTATTPNKAFTTARHNSQTTTQITRDRKNCTHLYTTIALYSSLKCTFITEAAPFANCYTVHLLRYSTYLLTIKARTDLGTDSDPPPIQPGPVHFCRPARSDGKWRWQWRTSSHRINSMCGVG